MDRLTSKATPEGTLNYTYDAAGHVASVSSSNTNGVSVSYAYDDLNRLSTVTDNRLTGANVTTYTYDTASNLGTVTYPNGIQSTFNYDQLNRVSAMATQSSGYAYQRGPTGNLTGATELNGRTESWSYDGIYRLTNEAISQDPSQNNGTVSYSLDPVGNRLSEVSSLGTVPSGSSTFNADDELSSEAYDQDGNAIAEGGKTLRYDSQNELVSMNGGAATITYDGLGNRIAKIVNGVTTHYLVDDLNPTGYPQVVDELTNGVVTRTYTYGWQRISEDQIVSNQWTPSFYVYDGEGSVRQLTSIAGTATDSYEYDAFGNKFTVTGNTPNNYLYRGEQYDPDLNLYYLRARYYDPLTGRFLSQDPFPGTMSNPKSLHRYQYTGADPVNYVDPSGLDALSEYAFNLGRGTASIPELIGVGFRVVCLYETAAAGLDVVNHFSSTGLLAFSFDVAACSATGEGEVPEAEEPGPPEEEPNSGEGSDCPLCFAAGTPVHTNHGDVPVEKIAVGDEVIARNSETGKLEQEPVTALVPQHMGKLLEIRVEGEHDPLRPSVGHPFWVRHGDDPLGTWMESGKIRVGDLLETADGNWRRVTSITPVSSPETVYNFTVDKDHDYFVGQTGFLVHNANSCNCQPESPAQLYALYDGFGNFLKWGISFFAPGRYSGPALEGLGGAPPPQVVLEGTRREMLDMEDFLIKCAPGPLNMEKRAGSSWR